MDRTIKENELKVLSNLKKLREEQGFTQDELAARAGVSRSFIARQEALHVPPSFGTVKLYNALGWKVSSVAEIIKILESGKNPNWNEAKIPLLRDFYDPLKQKEIEKKEWFDLSMFPSMINIKMNENKKKYAVIPKGLYYNEESFKSPLLSAINSIVLIVGVVHNVDLKQILHENKSGRTIIVFKDDVNNVFLVKDIIKIQNYEHSVNDKELYITSLNQTIIIEDEYNREQFIISKLLRPIGIVLGITTFSPVILYGNTIYGR